MLAGSFFFPHAFPFVMSCFLFIVSGIEFSLLSYSVSRCKVHVDKNGIVVHCDIWPQGENVLTHSLKRQDEPRLTILLQNYLETVFSQVIIFLSFFLTHDKKMGLVSFIFLECVRLCFFFFLLIVLCWVRLTLQPSQTYPTWHCKILQMDGTRNSTLSGC